MLSGLSIRNVVLIEALELECSTGLTALTGETGAGKSIILDALSMATGARSDKGLVRKGTDKAQCTAIFHVPDQHPVHDILSNADFDLDGETALILRRVIREDGRSKAYLNDTPVSIKLLSELGAELLEVHGQHDGRGLLDPSQHIRMLDLFGGYAKELSRVKSCFDDLQSSRRALEELKTRAEKTEADRDYFSYALEELDRLDVSAGEEAEIAARRRFLQGAEGALKELSAAQSALGGGEYENRVSAALAGIEKVRERIGEGNSQASQALGRAAEALERALLEANEAQAAVQEASSVFHLDPGDLDRTEQRLFAIKAACRKYDVTADALIEKRREFAENLSKIENIGADLEAALKQAEKAEQEFDKAARALTKARTKAASDLEKKVIKELPDLKMEKAQFSCELTDTSPSSLGRDKVRFLVATNPGSAMGPMDKVASGGELARFSLAIKVALAGKQDKVMIFDEVDQGVGGAVASAVGLRLRKLSDSGQVFIVTHSPQVAACAHNQYRIEKASKAKTTTTSVTPVAANEREEEIARMLAGETITDEARAAARQLMKAS